MSSEALAPIAPSHVSTERTNLYLKEKKFSWSGDSAVIKDQSGKKVYEIDAKTITMSERRQLLDKDGKIVGQLRKKKTPGLHESYYIGTEDDDKKCKVRLSGTFNPLSSDAKIYLGDDEIGRCSGNWRAKKFAIEIQGNEVASVGRKRTLTSMFTDADRYCIDVEPGVDLAFICLIALALDELYHEPEEVSISSVS